MAENKYSVRIRQASAVIDPLKRAIQKLGKDGKSDTEQYRNLLDQLKSAQAELDKLKRAEERMLKQEKATKTEKNLQPELDTARAVGDTAKAKELEDKIKKAGGTPRGVGGTTEGETSQAGKDTDKDGIPDAIDKDPNTPATQAQTPVTTESTLPSKKKVSKDKQTPTKTLTDEEQRAQALAIAGAEDFALTENIFNNVPSLNNLLKKAVAEDWTRDKIIKELRDDVWFRKNSGAIKQRYVQLFNYRDLVKTGQAQGTTQYEQDIASLERQIADKARKMGSGIASDPEALRKAAENMYITNVTVEDPMTTDFIAAAIRPIGSTIAGKATEGYSGEALKDYQAIQAIAKSNGFKISDILPGGANETQVLQGLAKGIIDPNRLAQDARKLAAQGQPQYVRDLLGQGYNLDQIYAPYKQTMASILEVNPDEIDLNDATLRSAITDKGDMNLYDFKKVLRQDKRWQYTEQAREDVSNVALAVLHDFGFQG